MRMAYYILRGIGYTLGVVAVMLVLWGRQSDSAYAEEWTQLGFIMVIVSLLIFCVSYALYALLGRRPGPGPGGKRIIPQ